ncbi:MAG: ABC transporter permease [Acidobacteria bacterium]|nr:ABC transporter permease [Acidobacteriota bacterium]MBW4044134.1 ABC transporter permease [Acidobacteriota bacterium]
MLRQSLQSAVRQLRKSPGYSIAVILTLALGIGVNTAVFSMVDGFLLRQLPYPEPQRLGALITHEQGISPRTHRFVHEEDDSHDLKDWRAITENVPSLLAATSQEGNDGINLTTGATVRYVEGTRVSAHYFDVLGIKPMLGRSFTQEEDMPGGPEAVVLSYGLWQSTFDANPAILGKTITLRGAPYTVVGVLPRGAQMPTAAQLWVPQRPGDPHGECGGNNCAIYVRLKPGATWEQVRAQLSHVRVPAFDEIPSSYHGAGWFYVQPLQRELAGDMRDQIRVLMVAVGLILLIACGNLAGLALVRISRRTQELATRLALGAGRWAVLFQLWTESLVLSLLGATVGVAFAWLILLSVARLVPTFMIPIGGFTLDERVLAFATVASIGTSLLFGALPSLATRRVDIRTALASGSRNVAGQQGRLRQWLIGAEVALTVVLLAGAGLLVRTLIHLETLPPGFNPDNVMTAKASLDDARYHQAAAFQSLLTKSVADMRQIPGVRSAAVALSLPYERGLNDGIKFIDGPPAGTEEGISTVWVTPEYFDVLRIPVLSGRTFRDSDTDSSEGVLVVNAAFGRKFYHNPNPLGRHLQLGKKSFTIVGVVGDVAKAPGIVRDVPLSTEPVYYTAAAQTSQQTINLANVWFQPSWIVRTRGAISGLTAAMQQALAKADPALPFSGFYSMSEIEAQQLQQQRIEVTLLSTLAGLALLLSAIGIYSLVSNIVVQRTREIGIRIALGSTTREAMATVGASGMISALSGTAAGILLSFFTLRVLKSQIYGISEYDPMTLIAVPILLMMIAFAASVLPAMRVSKIDPAQTLRSE